MKPLLIILLIASTIFASCEKCYQCTTTIVRPNLNGGATTERDGSEFCGTKKAKSEYEKSKTSSTSYKIGTTTYRTTTVTVCNK